MASMTKKTLFTVSLISSIAIPAALLSALTIGTDNKPLQSRPEGPCDIYAKSGTPCVAAHSSTRALYASYDGPLYQVMRESDRKTLDIGVVPPSELDPGAMPMLRLRTSSVLEPHAGSPLYTTSPVKAITLSKLHAEHS